MSIVAFWATCLSKECKLAVFVQYIFIPLCNKFRLMALHVLACTDPFTNDDLEPVVQSIESLTKSLRRQLVKYMLTTYANTSLFFVGKM